MIVVPQPIPTEQGCAVRYVRPMPGGVHLYLCVLWSGGFALTSTWQSYVPPTLDLLLADLANRPERWSDLVHC